MKKFLLVMLVVLMAFGCATAKKDVPVTNPAENATPPAQSTVPDVSKGSVAPAPVQQPQGNNPAPATGGDVKKLNMDVTDMSSASRNTLSEKEDPNAVKYPGVSIPNMAKKEKLNNAFIRSGKGEVDTNPYSPEGVKPESNTSTKKEDKGYGISNPVQKDTNNKVMLKKDAVTNPKDENIKPSYQVSNDNAKDESKKGVSDYREVVGVKNLVKKEVSDKIATKTGRESPTGTASGSKGSSSKINGVSIPNPVKKTTNTFIQNKIKGAGLWE